MNATSYNHVGKASCGIDVLRHILAIAVIMQHSTSPSRFSVETNADLRAITNWVVGAVAGFFLISGYFSKPQLSLLQYAQTQARRLLVPYLLFSIVYTLFLAVLGKHSLKDGLVDTMTLHGASWQLYFLPYLWAVSVGFASLCRLTPRNCSQWMIPIFAIVLTGVCMSLPTRESTGSNYRLIPFYALAYCVGAMTRRRDQRREVLLEVALCCVSTGLGFLDRRFFDLGGAVFCFAIANHTGKFLPARRLSGSGGVYLLHTPMVNFPISVALMKLGVLEMANAIASIGITYAVCLAISWIFIRRWPKLRWLLLE